MSSARGSRAGGPDSGDGPNRIHAEGVEAADHGAHTLRVWRGLVVGRYSDDVFVELGPRMQGVISAREFDEPPTVGDEYDFTLRGREEELWALALCPDGVLPDWADMEPGNQVQARIVRKNPGGFEVKVGPLHGFLPLSQCGVPREGDPEVLLGKTLAVEVVEVDPERQRIVVSRKLVLERARRSSHEREVGSLQVGTLVQGRITRVEEYGAFVRFGQGLQGLIHVSNLAHERVEDARSTVSVGQAVQARVLSIRAKGKRIALGLKQLTPSPWVELAGRCGAGDLVRGTVARHLRAGVLVRVAAGVEGFLHESETGVARGRPLKDVFPRGRELVLRVLALDVQAERLSLSRLRSDGTEVMMDDLNELPELDGSAGAGQLSHDLGSLLRRALQGRQSPPQR